MTRVISFEDGERHLDWIALTDALAAGHKLDKAEIADVFLYRGEDTLLNRSAWIDGLGLAVKCATIFPANKQTGMPMINGMVSFFSNESGELSALIDFHLVTKWKTAADSLLAARRLARSDSKTILIIGAGHVGRSLRQAYRAAFPEAKFLIWNRTHAAAEAFAAEDAGTEAVRSLPDVVELADIITSATMSSEPVLKGEWLRPGQHVDLIGAYRPDMREADDEVLRRGRIFVDSFDTTVEHIGEIKTPLSTGVIRRDDLVADYYTLDAFTRQDEDEITVFKNGGGAHLDLMTSRYILGCVENAA